MEHTAYWCSRCNSREKQPERTCDLHSAARQLLEAVQMAESFLKEAIDSDVFRNVHEDDSLQAKEFDGSLSSALRTLRNAINLATKEKNEQRT